MKHSHRGLIEANSSPGKRVKVKAILKNPFTMILGLLIVLELSIIVGFVLFHTLDKDKHSYLTYKKYSTAIALFSAGIMDGILINAQHEVTTNIKMDAYHLVVHELKEELFAVYKKLNNTERIESIQRYIHAKEIFKIREDDPIKEYA